jgi:hypothetical protein
MLVKNLPASDLIPVIFSRLVLDGFGGLYLGYKNGWPHLWAVLNAHFAFYAQIPESLRLRQKNQIKFYYQSKWLIFKHFLGTKNN